MVKTEHSRHAWSSIIYMFKSKLLFKTSADRAVPRAIFLSASLMFAAKPRSPAVAPVNGRKGRARPLAKNAKQYEDHRLRHRLGRLVLIVLKGMAFFAMALPVLLAHLQ